MRVKKVEVIESESMLAALLNLLVSTSWKILT
jgi:hypothetical protein